MGKKQEEKQEGVTGKAEDGTKTEGTLGQNFVLLYPNALKGAMRPRLATMDYRQNTLFEELMDSLGSEPFAVFADGSIGPVPPPAAGKE